MWPDFGWNSGGGVYLGCVSDGYPKEGEEKNNLVWLLVGVFIFMTFDYQRTLVLP